MTILSVISVIQINMDFKNAPPLRGDFTLPK